MCIEQKNIVFRLVLFPKIEHGSKAIQRYTATPLQLQIQNAQVYQEQAAETNMASVVRIQVLKVLCTLEEGVANTCI